MAWSESVCVGVLAGRLAECRRAKDSGCEEQMGWPARWSDDYTPRVGAASPAEVPNVFVLCHNPVDPGKDDDPACGEKGTSARLGDLRCNLITYILSPQLESPWGIMMDAEDPLTGEKISGSVNQWGGTLDRAAGSLTDVMGLLNGDVPPDQFIAGKNVSSWLADVQAGAAPGAGAMSASEIASRRSAFDPSVLASRLAGVVGTGKKPRGPPAVQRSTRHRALVDRGRMGPGNAALLAASRNLHRDADGHARSRAGERLRSHSAPHQRCGRAREPVPANESPVASFARTLIETRPCASLVQARRHRSRQPSLAREDGAKAVPRGRPQRRRGRRRSPGAHLYMGAPGVREGRLRARDRTLDGAAPQLRCVVRLAQLPPAVLAAPYQQRRHHQRLR